jgi:hypothetical protein
LSKVTTVSYLAIPTTKATRSYANDNEGNKENNNK